MTDDALLYECAMSALKETGRHSETRQLAHRFPGIVPMSMHAVRRPHQLARAVRAAGLQAQALELCDALLGRERAVDRVFLADWAEWLHRFVPPVSDVVSFDQDRSGLYKIDRDKRTNLRETSNRPVALAG